MLDDRTAEGLAEIGPLGDRTRVRILHALSWRFPLCVCDISAVLGATSSAGRTSSGLLHGKAGQVPERGQERLYALWRTS